MESRTRGNVTINGTGTATGGYVDEVKINGAGTITSDLDCINFTCNGTSDVKGAVKAERIRINGTTSIQGHVNADKIQVHGTIDVSGNLAFKEVVVNGSCDIGGMVSGESMEIQGSVSIAQDCEVELFTGKGGFTIDGLLNAGTIDFQLYGKARAREIGGETITIRIGKMFGLNKLIKSFFGGAHELRADVIEGDEIFLENTRAKVVRGKNIAIGEGCEIDEVEYTGTLNIHDDAKVRSYKAV
ncbi:polymer-forming cytoskeletal protein [Brevibacillus ruminantium]|uniref:Polymer-forming cytoskeletal protein n=1 Tax=Brevibacillus ruminantium TaxID=2950604 RepID=A0ABY4WJY3_9BACL|nr:polymer-forming cytoskeletal protein [Brevibacillus ruminantium]USG67468.1 polymer-forming cytoskeletal protein [Brevibacillus ruminantium]